MMNLKEKIREKIYKSVTEAYGERDPNAELFAKGLTEEILSLISLDDVDHDADTVREALKIDEDEWLKFADKLAKKIADPYDRKRKWSYYFKYVWDNAPDLKIALYSIYAMTRTYYEKPAIKMFTIIDIPSEEGSDFGGSGENIPTA